MTLERILVTGGAGFIGSNFIRSVLQTQPEVFEAVTKLAQRRKYNEAQQVRVEAPLYFSGGVALNEMMRRELERALGIPLRRSDRPQLTAALGAALLA